MDNLTEAWLYTEFSPVYGVSEARKIIDLLKSQEQMIYESRIRKELRDQRSS